MMSDRPRDMLRTALIGFAFAAVATTWCAWCVGPGLALLFGATILAALYVPPLTLAAESSRQWIRALGISIGVIACCGMSMGWAEISIGEWLECSLICAAFVLALSGSAAALARLGVAPPPAAATVMLVALLWLTWPVWMSHALTQSRANALAIAHPLLAINGVLSHLGSWDRAPIAYQRLTILNQDISYHLPRSILPAVLLHGLIGTGGLLLGCRRTPAALLRHINTTEAPT